MGDIFSLVILKNPHSKADLILGQEFSKID